jgi:hypothetical protein
MLLVAGDVGAQRGHNALGIRMTADGGGISFKSFVDRRFAVETQLTLGGIRYLDGRSVTAAGLIEYHLPLPSPRFRIFFGGGLHFGRWANRESSEYPDEFILGLDGVGGFEYMFPRSHWTISGDLRPALNYVQVVEFFPHGVFGVAVRYYFSSHK